MSIWLGKGIFLGISVKVLLKEIRLGFHKLNKKIHLSHVGKHHLHHWGLERNTKWGKGKSSLCVLELGCPSFPPSDMAPLVLRLSNSRTEGSGPWFFGFRPQWTIPASFLFSRSRLWDFLVYNHVSQFLKSLISIVAVCVK